MKIKTFTLIALLSMMAVGCQKENIVETATPIAEEEAVYSMYYSADGIIHHVILHSEEDVDSFYSYLMALVTGGTHVRVFGNNPTSQAPIAKEVVTFTTTDKNEATLWSKEMALNGYTVDMEYDSKTGVYTCTATK